MSIRSHRDLLVWQRAMELAAAVDALAARLPAHERYGLGSQLRRAAASIPANIAEGWARPTRAYIHHLNIALGSEAELQTLLELAQRVNLIATRDSEPALAVASQVGRMLRGLTRSLKAHLARTRP
jgi:four helix bundle protein